MSILYNWGYVLAAFALATIVWISYKRILINLGYTHADVIESMILDVINSLDKNTGNRSYHYHIPWTLIIGPPGAGKKFLMQNADADFYVKDGGEIVCSAHIHSSGVIINASSVLVLSQERRYAVYWKRLFMALVKYRKDQPLDSIVIAWPYKFLGDNTRQYWRDAIGDGITYIQKITGLRLSVYILLTGCESMNGFKTLTERLQQNDKNQLCGWSSSHKLGNYSPEWVTESIDYISKKLILIRDTIVAQSVTSNESLMYLDEEIEIAREHWEVEASEIFKFRPTSILPYIRGAYFVSFYTDADGKKQSHFTHDLFHQKIFVEMGVSEKLDKSSFGLYKFIHDTKYMISGLISVISIYGLARAKMVLEYNSKELQVCILKLSDQSLTDIDKILYHVNQAQRNSLFVPWVIYSWQSPIEMELRNFYRQIYTKILNHAIHTIQVEVNNELDRVSYISSIEDSHIEKSPKYLELMRFVDNINKFERQINYLYSGDAEKFRQVLTEIFPEILIPSDLYSVLESAECSLNTIIDLKRIVTTWDRLTDEFLLSLLNEANISQIKKLVDILSAVQEYPELVTKESLNDLSNSITDLIVYCRTDELSWLCYGNLSNHYAIQALISNMQKSQIFNALIPDFVSNCDTRILALRKTISSPSRIWPIVDNLFVANNNAIAVSNELNDLLGFLNLVLTQDFMSTVQDEFGQLFAEWDLKCTLLWNTEILSQGLFYIKKHENFVFKVLPKLPRRMRAAIEHALAIELLRTLRTKLHAAEILPSGHANTNAEYFENLANSIRSNQELFFTIIRYLKVLGFNKIIAPIVCKVARQAEDILERLKLFLDAEALYDVNELMNRSFQKKRLQLMLTQSRLRLDYIAQVLAEPLVMLYRTCHSLYPEYIKTSLAVLYWEEILTEVNNYNRGQTGSLLALENTIVSVLRYSDISMPKPVLPELRSEFFRKKFEELNASIDVMMSSEVDAALALAYKAILSDFNQHLAPYFPFNTAPNASVVNDAVLREFYRIYEERKPYINTLIRNDFASPQAVKHSKLFLIKMDCMKAWLGLIPMQVEIKAPSNVVIRCDGKKLKMRPIRTINWNKHRSIVIEVRSKRRITRITLNKRYDWIRYLLKTPRHGNATIIETQNGPIEIVWNFVGVGWPDFRMHSEKFM